MNCKMAACGLAVIATSCGVTEPVEQPNLPQGTPQQFMLAEGPGFRPSPFRDSTLIVEVATPDSVPHLRWWPTHIYVETDRGFAEEMLLIPHICIEPATITAEWMEQFPFNFEWWSCDAFGVNNEIVLTEEQIAHLEGEVGGKLDLVYEFQTMPGAQYYFRVGVGRAAIQNAMGRAEELPFIQGELFHPMTPPPCYLSDIVPPPPCAPWILGRRLPFSFGSAVDGVLPVSRGGSVRYLYASGWEHSPGVDLVSGLKCGHLSDERGKGCELHELDHAPGAARLWPSPRQRCPAEGFARHRAAPSRRSAASEEDVLGESCGCARGGTGQDCGDTRQSRGQTRVGER